MQTESNRRILIVDDNAAIHQDFRKILESATDASGVGESEAALFGDESAPTAAAVESMG
jgi:CheY-like chemotaxis protein